MQLSCITYAALLRELSTALNHLSGLLFAAKAATQVYSLDKSA